MFAPDSPGPKAQGVGGRLAEVARRHPGFPALVRSYGPKQEFITPHCPQQNGLVERVIRTLKEQCIHRQRFDSIQHATRAFGDWISFYNHRRPHQALDMKTPAEAFALAA